MTAKHQLNQSKIDAHYSIGKELTKTRKVVLVLGVLVLAACIVAVIAFFRIVNEPPGVLLGEAISPDGVYRATIRTTRDDGPGSYSWLDLELRQKPSPPNSQMDTVIMASAPWKAFRTLRWSGKRTLIVTYSAGPLQPASSGPLDPGFDSWRDVKVTYVKSPK